MRKNHIITNLSLEQYNKKYRNRRYRLVKFTKKEVEDFDKKHERNDKCVLATRKWALIGDTYYEIPRAPRFTWFRNLNTGVQIATSIVLAGGVASAVTFPLLANTVWNKDNAAAEELVFENVGSGTYICRVNLVKGNKYKAKCNAGDTQESSLKGFCLFAVLNEEAETVTSEVIKDLNIKTNLSEFKYCTITEFASKMNEGGNYTYIDNDNHYLISRNSFSKSECNIEIVFTSNATIENHGLLFEFTEM